MLKAYRLLPALVALCASAAVWGDAPRNFEKEVPADPKGVVEISNTVGTIDVTGWDKPAVGVKAELGDEVERVEVTSSGGHTSVRVQLKQHGFSWGHDEETHLHVQVPRGSELDVSGVSATLNSSGVLGAQRLHTVSGDITAETGPGDLEVKSVSGGLRIRGHGQPARLRLHTVSGDIDLKHAAGDLEVGTTNGGVSVQLDLARELHARSISGDVTFEGRLARGADVDLQSVSGELKVRAASEDGFRYELESLSGDINNCFNAKAERTSEYGPGHKLDGTRGAGSAHVRLKSVSGELDVCDR
jgi:DUF4097 and DUF4098 domain-containing protein YvlB